MPVTVTGGTRGGIQSLVNGTIVADGSEQTLLTFTSIGEVSGYVDLSKMMWGDKVQIRQYLRVDGVYQKYADEGYNDAQPLPIIYITPKESDNGLKVTLQQTVGVFRNYDYRFTVER